MEGGKLEHEGKVLSLENVDEEDDGPYYCQATSEAGEADPYRFNVYVEGKANLNCLLVHLLLSDYIFISLVLNC